jgi:hypothetical protein
MYMPQAQKDFHMGINFLEMKYKLIIKYWLLHARNMEKRRLLNMHQIIYGVDFYICIIKNESIKKLVKFDNT